MQDLQGGASKNPTTTLIDDEDIMLALDNVYQSMLDDVSDQAMPQLHWLWTLLKVKADKERKYDD